MVGRKPRPRALAHNERKRAERCNKRGERSRVYAGLVTSTPRGLAEGGSKHLFPRVCAPAINASVKHRATRKHTRARVRGQLKESLGKWTSCRTVFLFFGGGAAAEMNYSSLHNFSRASGDLSYFNLTAVVLWRPRLLRNEFQPFESFSAVVCSSAGLWDSNNWVKVLEREVWR